MLEMDFTVPNYICLLQYEYAYPFSAEPLMITTSLCSVLYEANTDIVTSFQPNPSCLVTSLQLSVEFLSL